MRRGKEARDMAINQAIKRACDDGTKYTYVFTLKNVLQKEHA